MIIVADTSGLFAALDAAQPEHAAAARVMAQESLVVSPLVVTELDRLIHGALGFKSAMQTMDALNARMQDGQYRLAELDHRDLVAAHDVRWQYSGLALDLADAVGVVLADRYRTDRIFTLDQRDFRSIAPLTRGFSAFRILPADLREG